MRPDGVTGRAAVVFFRGTPIQGTDKKRVPGTCPSAPLAVFTACVVLNQSIPWIT